MTFPQFLKELADVQATWRLEDGCITSDNDTCPINEVADQEVGDNGDVFENGERLGLSRRTVSAIINAADNRTHGKYRRKLLKACGLKEEVSS